MPLGNGERYYSSGIGRFIQQDSFTGVQSVPASLNRYSYAHNNPVIHTDPSGHIIPFLLAAGFLAGVLISVVEQDSEIQSGVRREEEFSMSEAFVNHTVIGNGYRAINKQDPVSGRELSGAEWAFEAVTFGLEIAGPVGEVLARVNQFVRIGKAAEAIAEAGKARRVANAIEGTEKATEIRRALTGAKELSEMHPVKQVAQAGDEVAETVTKSGRSIDDFMNIADKRLEASEARYGELGEYGGDGYASYRGKLMADESKTLGSHLEIKISGEYRVAFDSVIEKEIGLGMLDNGYLKLAIYSKETGTTARGSEIFKGIYDQFVSEGKEIKGIFGLWSKASDNTLTLNQKILQGMTPEQAALETFTGKMASRKGYNKVTIDYDKSKMTKEGLFESAQVLFER